MIDQPGKYRARCIDNPAEPRLGRSESGNEQIALTFALLDEDGRETSETIDWVGTFAEGKATEITIKAMRTCGWTGDSLDSLDGINDNEVELDVQWDEYKGEKRLRVKWVNRPGGNRILFKTALDPAGKKALAARLRGAIAASKPAGGSAAAKEDDRPDWAR